MKPLELEKKSFDKLQVVLWVVATIVTAWLFYTGYFKSETYEKQSILQHDRMEMYQSTPRSTMERRVDTTQPPSIHKENYQPRYAESAPPDKIDQIIRLIEVIATLILNLSALLIPLLTMWLQRNNLLIQTKDKTP